MTVTDLATILDIKPTDLIKKLMGLGVMASLNQALDYDTVEVIVTDYDKVLKKEETADISNFENYEIVDDWGYTPNLYHFDGMWLVDWIHCEEGDSLTSFNGDTPEDAIEKAYKWKNP